MWTLSLCPLYTPTGTLTYFSWLNLGVFASRSPCLIGRRTTSSFNVFFLFFFNILYVFCNFNLSRWQTSQSEKKHLRGPLEVFKGMVHWFVYGDIKSVILIKPIQTSIYPDILYMSISITATWHKPYCVVFKHKITRGMHWTWEILYTRQKASKTGI